MANACDADNPKKDQSGEDASESSEASSPVTRASNAPDISHSSDETSPSETETIEALLWARHQSWMGPLPPPEAVAAYQRIDPRFVDAIRESLEIQNRNDAENGATIRRNLERTTDLRFEEQTLRKEERRDDIRTRRDNRTLIVGISVGWVVLFLVVLFAPPLTAGTRAWVLVALCGLAAAPIIAIVVRWAYLARYTRNTRCSVTVPPIGPGRPTCVGASAGPRRHTSLRRCAVV